MTLIVGGAFTIGVTWLNHWLALSRDKRKHPEVPKFVTPSGKSERVRLGIRALVYSIGQVLGLLLVVGLVKQAMGDDWQLRGVLLVLGWCLITAYLFSSMWASPGREWELDDAQVPRLTNDVGNTYSLSLFVVMLAYFGYLLHS